jgi:hypothetical protein
MRAKLLKAKNKINKKMIKARTKKKRIKNQQNHKH